MAKYLIKILLASLIILTIGVYVSAQFYEKKISWGLAPKTLDYVTQLLIKKPEKEWQATLTKLQPNNAPVMFLLPLKAINFSTRELAQLKQGQVITRQEEQSENNAVKFGVGFLIYTFNDAYLYKQIPGADVVLKSQQTISIQDTVKQSFSWVTHIINQKLSETQPARWPQLLEQLQKEMSLTLTLTPRNQVPHDNNYLNPGPDGMIKTVIMKTPDPSQLLVIGPINYPVQAVYLRGVSYLIVYGLAFLLISFFTWLFYNNLHKIYVLTKQYSTEQFDSDKTVSTLSALYPLYRHVKDMGEKLKQLTESQKNMTRFVAHEARTPMSTMLMAIQAIQKDENLPPEAQAELQIIAQEVKQLNLTVSDFLVTSQTLWPTHEKNAHHD